MVANLPTNASSGLQLIDAVVNDFFLSRQIGVQTPVARAVCQDKPPTQEPLKTFDDLQRNDVSERPFKIEGYVIQTYKCPPCPPRMQCKPCIGNHIVVTDNVEEKNAALIKRLRIFTDKPEQFELKKMYSFVVKVRGKVREGHAIEEVDLISFQPLKK